ncbi:ATP-grasp fold amidoligase family protein [Escherichia coli]|uniref:ATP-grasp fold amidoligase family protein n=1 Tax=Escherichia coli TaxID=562 RepID=UPI00333266D8
MELSSILCEDFNYVRVDWYIYDNKPYFGELTFTLVLEVHMNLVMNLKKLMAKYWQL